MNRSVHAQLASYRSERASPRDGIDGDVDKDGVDDDGVDGDVDKEGVDYDGVCSSHDGDRPEDVDVMIADVLEVKRRPADEDVCPGGAASDDSEWEDILKTVDLAEQPDFDDSNGPTVLIGDVSEASGDSDGAAGAAEYSLSSSADSDHGDDGGLNPGGADDIIDESQPEAPIVVAEPVVDERQPAARGRRQHIPCTADRSNLQPANCSLRRYDPPPGNKPPYWLGRLPDNCKDDEDRARRTRSFREGLRT